MAGITSFTATALDVGSALRFNWTLDASLNASNTTDIRLYLDMSLVDNVIQEVEVIPLADASGVLTTSYTVDGLINGQQYRVLLEVSTMDASNNVVVYSSHLKAIPSTKPNKVFIKVGQDSDNGFYLELYSDAALTTKLVPNSVDDGFSPLTGAYVVISNDLSGNSVYLDNSGNRLYTDRIQMTAPFGQHEVNVRVVNIHGSSKTSATANLTIGSSITAVNVVNVAEHIALDPAASGYDEEYLVPAMILAWNAPNYTGSPQLTQYVIQRAPVVSGVIGLFADIATVDSTNSNSLSYINAGFSYRDYSIVVGSSYAYNIVGKNVNGRGANAVYADDSLLKSAIFRAVAWPLITSVNSVPGNGSSVISSTMNGGFISAGVEFEVNADGMDSVRSANPVTLTGLTNLTQYSYMVTGYAPSPNVEGKVYATPASPPYTTTPIESPPSVVSFSGTALDADANPMDGTVKLYWQLSSNVATFQVNYTVNTYIYRKESASPDASYTLIHTLGANNVLHYDNGLVNGTNYSYYIRTGYYNSETASNLYGSPSSPVSVKPFATPAKPSFVDILSNNSSTDLSYTFLDDTNISGSTIVGHRFTLFNMNNGRTSTAITDADLVMDVNDGYHPSVNKLGNLFSIFNVNLNPGTLYELALDSYVIENGVKYYSTPNGVELVTQAYNYTVPSGLTNVVATNVDALGHTLSTNSTNGGVIRLSWDYPDGQDASNVSFRVVNANTGGLIATVNNDTLHADITGLSVGISTINYKVLAILPTIPPSVAPLATAQSVSGIPVFKPNAVSGITIIDRDSGSIDFSFNGVTYHGGMDSSGTIYLVELYDYDTDTLVGSFEMGHAAGSLLGNFNELTPGVYQIHITTKALNPMVANEYISSDIFASSRIAIYDAAENVTLFEAKPSDAKIVAKWAPVLSLPSGLNFIGYQLAIKMSGSPDASYHFIDIVNVGTSVYTLADLLDLLDPPTSLANNIEYAVRIRVNYEDLDEAGVFSPWSTALLVTPKLAPSTPTGLEYTLNSVGTIAYLAWNIVDTGATVPSHYSIVVDSGDAYSFHFEVDNVSVNDLSYNNTKHIYPVTGLTPGRIYNAKVYAEFKTIVSEAVYYTSSDPAEMVVNAFESPSVPLNLTASMGDTQFIPKWSLPTNTGGQYTNLKYEIYLSTPDASGNYPVVESLLSTLTNTPIVGTSFKYIVTHSQMVSGLKFTGLTNITQQYAYVVRAVILNDADAIVASSPTAALDRLYARPPPSNPVVTPTLVTTATKSNIQVVVTSDLSFNLTKYELYRKIKAATGTSDLTSFELIAEKTFVDQSEDRTWTVIDDNTVSSPFWLDSHRFYYKAVAHYNDDNINPNSGANGDEILETISDGIVKKSKPFICGVDGLPVSPSVMTADTSANTLTFLVNMSGGAINSVNAVLLADANVEVRSGSPGNEGIVVSQRTNAIVQNSVGNNGGTAKNQVVEIKLSLLDFATLDDALAVVGNAIGTAIAIWPSDGAFSDLRN